MGLRNRKRSTPQSAFCPSGAVFRLSVSGRVSLGGNGPAGVHHIAANIKATDPACCHRRGGPVVQDLALYGAGRNQIQQRRA